MPQNLMNKAHKGTNQNYRDGWDRTYGETDRLTLEEVLKAIEYARNSPQMTNAEINEILNEAIK